MEAGRGSKAAVLSIDRTVDADTAHFRPVRAHMEIRVNHKDCLLNVANI